MPFAYGDLPVVAAAGDAGRPTLLLSAAETIGKSIVGVDVVHLRRGLVVPGTPGLAPVHGDDGALVAGQKNDLWKVGIDPYVLVVIAARSAAKAGPGLAAVGRLPGHRASDVNDIRILGVDHRHR